MTATATGKCTICEAFCTAQAAPVPVELITAGMKRIVGGTARAVRRLSTTGLVAAATRTTTLYQGASVATQFQPQVQQLLDYECKCRRATTSDDSI